MDVFWTYGLYILLGILAGTLSGLLGVGGGVIVVPGFIWLFEYQGFASDTIMHIAAGSSLAAMIITTLASAYAHYRRGATFGSILYIMIPGLVIGTAGGAVLAHFIHSVILRILFGTLVFVISLKEFFDTRSKKILQDKKTVNTIGISGGSVVIGVLSGLLGVGGGTLIVPFLEYCGVNIKNAISISIACGLVTAVTGTISFILIGFHQLNLPPDSLGYIYLPACIGVSIGSPIFAFLGARLHQYLRIIILKRIFSVFLMVVALRLLL